MANLMCIEGLEFDADTMKPTGRPCNDKQESFQYDIPNIPGLIGDKKTGRYLRQDGTPATPEEIAQAASAARTSSSSSRSSSSSISYQDPVALQLRQIELENEINVATRNQALAERGQDFEEMKFWQERLDKLQQNKQAIDLEAAKLASSSKEASLSRQERAQLAAQQQAETQADRAARTAEFAMTHGLNERRFQTETQVAQANMSRQREQDKLGAARQFADVISTVDPGAYSAFHAAGGGNIMAALSRGKTALSDEALTPGAMTLQTIDQLNQPLPNYGAMGGGGVLTRPGAPVGGGGGAADYSNLTPQERADMQARMDRQWEEIQTEARAGRYGTTNYSGDEEALARAGFNTAGARTAAAAAGTSPTGTQFAPSGGGYYYGAAGGTPLDSGNYASGTGPPAGSAQAVAQSGPGGQGKPTAVYNPQTGNLEIQYRAMGGLSRGPTVVGEPRPGERAPNPELIIPRTPGAVFDVVPLRGLAEGGTIRSEDNYGMPVIRPEIPELPTAGRLLPEPQRTVVTPGTGDPHVEGQAAKDPAKPQTELTPFLDKVRQLRMRTEFGRMNPYSTKFFMTDPVLRQRYLMGMQNVYGIPAESLQAEGQRYALPGLSRSQARV